MKNRYSDNGDGTYTNPVLYADYSDPDAIRVGDDYYMVASSFCNTPGLPILWSQDLVNWKVINYALENIPYESYKTPRHGCGVWAPAIRYYDGEFIIFFPMPDEGIFVVRTKDPRGKWSEPEAVFEGKGWIDPCPFLDDDGKAYMVNGFAKSRAGFKSILQVVPLSRDFSRIDGEPVRVFDGNTNGQHTIEGPKLYKRNGWYYIFAPAGGVKQGWQTVLRSRDIYGPYEFRNVCEQKDTEVNGPHQGAWVDTVTGEDCFLHFQDVYSAGRIIHLQPMKWKDDWPVIGRAEENEICGKPVITYKKPVAGKKSSIFSPEDSDEFDSDRVGLQWQWNANHEDGWIRCIPERSMIELYSQPAAKSVSDQPNLFLQKWPAPEFSAITKLDISGMNDGEEAGIISMGVRYAALSVYRSGDRYALRGITGEQVFRDETAYAEDRITEINGDISGGSDSKEIYFKCTVTRVLPTEYNEEGKYRFPVPKETVVLSYSTDGHNYCPAVEYDARAGRWVGVKCGIYIRDIKGCGRGSVRSDYFRFT